MVLSTPRGSLTPSYAEYTARLIDVNDGTTLAIPVDRWFTEPSAAELALLRLAIGPVLDVGCGPGRHVLALTSGGVPAIGIDVSTPMVQVARRSGAAVIECSVFDDVPGAGSWGSALLLDGNIGIGANPGLLLERLRQLLRRDGRVLLEAAPPMRGSTAREVQLCIGQTRGPVFLWAAVGVDEIGALAAHAGLRIERCWSADRRWFVWLEHA